MAINFPDSPTNGQVALVGGKNYTYNSTKNTWTPTQVTEADLSTVGSTTVVATHDLLPASPSAGDMALVSSVNKMYVYFLSGWWLMSSLQNASPSGITGNAAIYDLAADGTPTTVTLSSSDPEGFPISWSHSVISGSLGGTTVTNVDNVFTITPSTDAADAGTFTLRFAAADGQGGESGSQSNFTLDFVFIVANSRYTTLLATAVDTSDNNNITDESTNNHTITANGDAHAGTFSPYRSGGYSTSFAGSNSSRLEIASMPAIGSGDCSIECWVKINSQAWNGIISRGAYLSSGTFSLSTRSGDSEITLVWNGSIYTTSGANININEWNWIQVVRSSGTITIYVNGISRKSVSNSANISSTSNYIIGRVDSSDYFGGQIRDLRISTSARSSSAGLEKLEVDSYTTFLSCHLPYMSYSTSSVVSNSYSNTPSSIAINSFSPYDYEEYSATDNGGSIFVDNLSSSTDSVSCTLGSAIGTGDFSISGWFYPPEVHGSGNKRIWTLGGNNNVNGLGLLFQTNGQIRLDFPGNTTSFGGSGPNIVDKWQHFCIRRISGTATLHLDGVQKWTQSNNTINLSATNLEVGRDTSGLYGSHGYISDFKISTSNLEGTTVATEPTSSTGALVHIKGTGASIIDKSQNANLKLIGGPTGSTTQAKFANTKSIDFGDGSQTYVMEVSSGAGYIGEFTIEFWMYNTYVTSTWQSLISNSYVSGSEYFRLYKNNGSGAVALYHNSTSAKLTGIGTIANNTWTHVAIVRDSSNDITVYQDGISIGSYNNNQVFGTASSPVNVGKGGVGDSTNYPMSGYIQDLRITDGLARYTANFTPPTEPLEG